MSHTCSYFYKNQQIQIKGQTPQFLRLFGLFCCLFSPILLSSQSAFARTTVQQRSSAVCYTVADGYILGDDSSHDEEAQDTMIILDLAIDNSLLIAGEQSLKIDQQPSNRPVTDIEAIALEPTGALLYGADGNQLGILNIENGAFNPLPFEFGAGSGYQMGRWQTSQFDDVDGLSFDPTTGLFYGVDRNPDDLPDTLFQIDPKTGRFVDNAFLVNGQAADFVEIEPLSGLDDVDDIAIDPKTGELFAIFNRQGEVNSKLAIIDKETGETTEVGDLYHAATDELPEMEGLTAAVIDGQTVLYGSTGQSLEQQNMLWQIDPKTAAVAALGVFGEQFVDVESIACMQKTGEVIGVVWDDLNFDGVQEEDEPGLPDVDVELYAADSTAPEQSTKTDIEGIYRFIIGTESYNLQFSAPSGYQFGPPNQADEALDSDPDPKTGIAGPLELSTGSHLLNWSASLLCTLPQLEIQLSNEELATMPGETVSYKLGYENIGQGSALNVVITEIVPEHTTFIPQHSTPGWICLNNPGTDRVECLYEIGIVTAGEPGIAELESVQTELLFTVAVDHPLDEQIETIDNQVSINYVSECGKVIDGQGGASIQVPIIRPTSVDEMPEPVTGIQLYLPIAYD